MEFGNRCGAEPTGSRGSNDRADDPDSNNFESKSDEGDKVRLVRNNWIHQTESLPISPRDFRRDLPAFRSDSLIELPSAVLA